MPTNWYGYCGFTLDERADRPARVGHPRRDRVKVRASRKAARRNR